MYLVFTRVPGESCRRRLGSTFTCVTYFERRLSPLCVDLSRAKFLLAFAIVQGTGSPPLLTDSSACGYLCDPQKTKTIMIDQHTYGRPLRARLCARPEISPDSNSLQSLQNEVFQRSPPPPPPCVDAHAKRSQRPHPVIHVSSVGYWNNQTAREACTQIVENAEEGHDTAEEEEEARTQVPVIESANVKYRPHASTDEREYRPDTGSSLLLFSTWVWLTTYRMTRVPVHGKSESELIFGHKLCTGGPDAVT